MPLGVYIPHRPTPKKSYGPAGRDHDWGLSHYYAPDTAPGELFARERRYAGIRTITQLPSDLRGFLSSTGVMQTSRKQRSSALGLYDLNACLLRRPALRSSIFQLRKGLQSCTCGQPLHCHLRIH